MMIVSVSFSFLLFYIYAVFYFSASFLVNKRVHLFEGVPLRSL